MGVTFMESLMALYAMVKHNGKIAFDYNMLGEGWFEVVLLLIACVLTFVFCLNYIYDKVKNGGNYNEHN